MESICVYTDGACSNNGNKNARAGIGIYFGEGDERNVSKPIGGKQTNNTAELKAIIEVYYMLEREINEGRNILICSDSQYAIWCCTTYGEKCAATNWKKKKGKEIPNCELVKQAFGLFKDKKNIQFKKVLAHTKGDDKDSIGNEGADKLANIAIGMTSCPYQKIYLDVPYEKKDLIKKMGGRWDYKKKKWYMFEKLYNIHQSKIKNLCL